MSLNHNLYSLYKLDGQFIGKSTEIPENFIGISECEGGKSKWWRSNKVRHRIGGPAVIEIGHDETNEEYWIHGKLATKEQHDLLCDMMKLKGLL